MTTKTNEQMTEAGTVMNRRDFLKKSPGAAGGFVLSNRTLDVSVGAKRPNVLFVLADQWRDCSFSHGAHHDELVKTPNFDRLTEQGVRWSR